LLVEREEEEKDTGKRSRKDEEAGVGKLELSFCEVAVPFRSETRAI